MANHTLLKELQQKIDYQFKDENLLFTALTHSSYANEKKLGKAGCIRFIIMNVWNFLGMRYLKLYPVISCLRISLIWQKVR